VGKVQAIHSLWCSSIGGDGGTFVYDPRLCILGESRYAYLTFILFMFLYSTVNIPYTALLGVMTADPVERTSASSFKFVGAYLGGIVVSMTVLPFAAHFGHASPQKGWQITMGSTQSPL